MDVVLKNVQEKHLELIKSLAKVLDIEFSTKEDKRFDSDQKNPDAATALGKEEKIKKIIKEIDEQWE